MTLEEIEKEASALPTQDKWTLASFLFQELQTDAQSQPLPPEYLDELDCRMEEYRLDPSKGSSWEEVKARILGKKRASA